jgi:RimJ/RimL family protein N-acetyltransferase
MADHRCNPKVGIFKVFGIDYQNRTADTGWDIFEDHRGKGFGKKLVAAGAAFCFNILNLHRLNAEILSTNVASLRCAEAAGYVLEGTRRQAVHKEGKYVDSHILGILFSDANLGLQSKSDSL